MKRIGLFGGSFDPVHNGHLLMAQAAIEEASLDTIYFILAAQSPFKAGRQPTSAAIRAKLLRLALAGRPDFALDIQETQRDGLSYTIDTVKIYQRQHPDASIVYLIGADHVPLLPKWRSAEELARSTEFLAIPRPGATTEPFPPPFRGQVLKGFPFGISSTLIRRRANDGLPINEMTPPAVAAAIEQGQLYRST
ncbi:MAG: nicotinate-nucleotide adenylyltransferase [Candidatus Binatia bacterium]|jgi:nicotinate-nucleotide adenylyltransferase